MMLEEEWLVAVTAGRWQMHGMKEAKKTGLKILAIDADPSAEGFAEADEILSMGFDNHDAIIKAIHQLDLNIKGAVSFCSEVGMLLAASIREEFNLPGPRHELCNRLLNKELQRQIWFEKKVPGPDAFIIFHTKEETLAGMHSLALPFIIKPTDSSGSRGVTKIESFDDDLVDAVDRAFQFSRSGSVIVESYMDGTEFTVEVFITSGKVHVLAVTEKKKVEGTKGTVASELATPDRPSAILERMSNAVSDAFLALDYTDGPGHAEIILKKDNSVGLVEVAGRGGGFMVFNRLVPLVSGVNIARITSLQAVGKPVGEISNKKRAAVLRFFPSKPGILTGISGFEKANQLEGVESAPFVKVGDEFKRAAADGDRMGYIISSADTPQKAQALANQAESLIHFEIKSF